MDLLGGGPDPPADDGMARLLFSKAKNTQPPTFGFAWQQTKCKTARAEGCSLRK